jgi:hypothetical protein
MLDDAGFTDVAITASNDLDEYTILSLKSQGCAINSWGVGTRLITSADSPSLGGVYKLAGSYENGSFIPKIKISENAEKISNPGFKKVVRIYNNENKAEADLIMLNDEIIDTTKPLKVFHPIYTWKTSADVVLGSAPTDVGSYKLVVSANGGTEYNVTDLEIAFDITKANQIITFSCPASGSVGGTINLSATASSGLSGITFVSQNTVIALVSGSTLTLVGEGSVIITASHPGNANYNAASADCTINIVRNRVPDYSVIQHFAHFDGNGHRVAIIDADHLEFVRLMLDGVEIHNAHYTITSGSTIITLSETYLLGLAPGTYTVHADFGGGNQTALTLTVLSNITVPRTGLGLFGGGGGGMQIVMGAVVAAGLIGVAVLRIVKRKRIAFKNK